MPHKLQTSHLQISGRPKALADRTVLKQSVRTRGGPSAYFRKRAEQLSALHLQIAPWSGGQIYIRYRKVDCTPPGSIKIELMNVNGDYGWLRLTAQVTITPPPESTCPLCYVRTAEIHLDNILIRRLAVHSQGPRLRRCELAKNSSLS